MGFPTLSITLHIRLPRPRRLRTCIMSDPDAEALEEERLMRAMSRQGVASPRRTFKPKADPYAKKEEEKKEEKPKTPAGELPAWKKRQLEKEEAERKRKEAEEARKAQNAKLILDRVAEFGNDVNQEDDKVEEYLLSPRDARGDKPEVSQEQWEHEEALKKEKQEEEEYEDNIDHSVIPSYDERAEDERAAKEEERLMKLIEGK